MNRKIFVALGLLCLMAWFIAPTGASAGPLDDATRQDVLINAGDVVLGATLYRPAGKTGMMPAIVTAHGSAPTTREGVGFYTHHALSLGFAVLSFDKRGTGKSTGSYVPFSVSTSKKVFSDLAEDLVFAVRWLSAQPEIDVGRIGLFGGSQAGWIMPLAASRESLVSFVIIGAGVPLTAYEEDFHGNITGDGNWQQGRVEQADAALRELAMPEDLGFDPAPILQALNIPTLWMFGLRDAVIPVGPSLARLEVLIRQGKTNNDLYIFAFGDHNFSNVATGRRYDVGKVVGQWLDEKGFR